MNISDFSNEHRSLTSIGAAIVLLSVATEPFIQQTINFREDLIFATNSNVQIPYSQSWSGGSEIASPPGTASSSTGRQQVPDASLFVRSLTKSKVATISPRLSTSTVSLAMYS